MNRQELIKRLHTYTETKHHPRANKFQSKTYHTNSPATQEHSPELQYTGCPKGLQTHWHLITHYWTLHCTPEVRNPAPPTRTPTQASLTRKPWQATRTTPPQWGNSTKFTTLVFANVYFISYEHSSCLSFKRQIHFLSPSIRSGLPWKASQSGLKQTLQLVASLKHWTGEQLPSVRPRPARAEQAGREPPDGAFSASLCPPPQSSSAFEQ